MSITRHDLLQTRSRASSRLVSSTFIKEAKQTGACYSDEFALACVWDSPGAGEWTFCSVSLKLAIETLSDAKQSWQILENFHAAEKLLDIVHCTSTGNDYAWPASRYPSKTSALSRPKPRLLCSIRPVQVPGKAFKTIQTDSIGATLLIGAYLNGRPQLYTPPRLRADSHVAQPRFEPFDLDSGATNAIQGR